MNRSSTGTILSRLSATIENPARLTSAKPVKEFKFSVRIKEDSGSHGASEKTVEAKDQAVAWIAVIKDLRSSGLLRYVVSLTLNSNKT